MLPLIPHIWPLVFCAIPPHRKREEIQRSYRAFNINDDEFCKNAGISVTGEPLKVTARVLSPPQIFYANGQVNVAEGKWRLPKFAKFISTSSCQKWVAVLVDYQFPRPFEFEKLRAFCNDFLEECRIRGMSFAGPQDIVKISPDDAALDKLFNDAYKVGIEFILLAHPDGETILHDHIKTFERKYMVVTQCVRTSTIDKVIGKQSKLTLENFIAKTNVKLGGLNYDVFLKDYEIDRKTLFIGIGMNHPGGGKLQQEGANESSVSILGYSANDSHDPGAFIGNFFVQPPFQDENLSILDDLMDEVLGRFKRNRGCAPSRVVVYRSGCSEGQFQRVLLYEVPIILHFVKKYNSAAPVTFIVPSVLHNVRLFKKDIDPSKRSPEQNIPPGTVVDTTIVHSKFLEFYLNSHTAIQGTAKTPRYTVVFTSETHATLDIFERWTNALCYSYQIVASPVSVPAPVYVANCYAERGRQIANNFGLTKLTAAQKENGLAFSAEDKPEEGKQEIVKKSYSYNFTHRPTLRDRRINA
uniref:Piwi domain-containing protein n=1 Tax=Panagrolaimus superbus TaxID=310955 RepID=A0A914Z626_9BILA